jgi:hypothetical protein
MYESPSRAATVPAIPAARARPATSRTTPHQSPRLASHPGGQTHPRSNAFIPRKRPRGVTLMWWWDAALLSMTGSFNETRKMSRTAAQA